MFSRKPTHVVVVVMQVLHTLHGRLQLSTEQVTVTSKLAVSLCTLRYSSIRWLLHRRDALGSSKNRTKMEVVEAGPRYFKGEYE